MTTPDPARIAALLTTTRFGRSLDVRATTGSTNDDARAVAKDGAPCGHVVLADAQTAGRGSHGRTWSSPEGTDLYFSVVVRAQLPAASAPAITLAAGLGVADAVARAAPDADVRIKWPNDVRLDDRKCAGILTETQTAGAAKAPSIVGVGINVNRTTFDDSLRADATSLAVARGEPVDRACLLADTLGAMERWIDQLARTGPEPIAAEVTRRLAWKGEPVRCGDTTGTLTGLAPTGALRLQTPQGITELLAGTLTRT